MRKTTLCPKCFKEMKPLFANGRSVWCQKCEGHPKKEKKDGFTWIDGEDFKMREKEEMVDIFFDDEDDESSGI